MNFKPSFWIKPIFNKWIWFFAFDLVLVLTAATVLSGDKLLQSLVADKIQELKEEKNLKVQIEGMSLPWFTRFEAEKVLVSNDNYRIDFHSLQADFSWWSLITRRLSPKSVAIDSIWLTKVEHKLQVQREEDTLKIADRLEFVRGSIGRLRKIFPKIPKNISLNHLELRSSDSSSVSLYQIDSLRIQDQLGNFQLSGAWGRGVAKVSMQSDQLSLEWHPKVDSLYGIPPPFSRWIKRAGSLSVALNLDHSGENELIDFDCHLSGVVIDHKALHTESFELPKTHIKGRLELAPNQVSLSDLAFHTGQLGGTLEFIAIFDSLSLQTASFQLDVPAIAGKDWQKSLPSGVFQCLETLKTKGKLGLELKAEYSAKQEVPLQIVSQVKQEDFRLLSGGSCGLSKLSGNFTYFPWRSSRSLSLGSEGAGSYTKLDKISPYLRSSVLNSEDGSFFWHNGFNDEALAESLIENVERGTFRRGGSTITMQLVKNVFLSRRKTIVRKLEEIAIVWFIERFRLTSKERMFEMYLNLIEWGPEIYGIREASQFYFSTLPSQLDVEQSIFLSSIIPSPRAFRYRFESTQPVLRDFNGPYFNLIGHKLRQQKIITEVQRESIDYSSLRLRGDAANRLRVSTNDMTAANDSISGTSFLESFFPVWSKPVYPVPEFEPVSPPEQPKQNP